MHKEGVVGRWHDEFGEISVVDSDGIRYLYFGNDIVQSAVNLTDPARLCLSYTRAMMVGLLFCPTVPLRCLVIGLGGGAVVHFLKRHFPESKICVVELRETLIDIAKTHFELQSLNNIDYWAGDGHDFLRHSSSELLDLIIVDAFDEHGVAPSVASDAFLAHCTERLSQRGLVIFNLWRSQRVVADDILDSAQTRFGRHLLGLPLPDKGNLILFAGGALKPMPKKHFIRDHAKAHEQAWGIELRKLIVHLTPMRKNFLANFIARARGDYI